MFTVLDPTPIQPLMQRAINTLASSAEWDEKAAMKCHINGLQGEKRRLRKFKRKCCMTIDSLKHGFYGKFGIELEQVANPADVTNLIDCKTTMPALIEKVCLMYETLHCLSNEMIAAKYKKYAQALDCLVDELFDLIDELQRANDEYEKAGYEYHHISRYQVSYYNVHDQEEPKEESQGYQDL